MGQRTDQIEAQIEEERGELRSNLDELGARVRSATDWRHQFRNNPMLGLGLAFGGGLLLASLLRGAARGRNPTGHRERGRGQLVSAWEAIQGALIGVTVNKVTDVLGNLVPAFREHLGQAVPSGSGRHGNGHGDGAPGEGNYEAARRYRAGAERYVRTADVAAAARAAEPRTEAEADELAAAEEKARSRAKPS